jgi:hypothetical protein
VKMFLPVAALTMSVSLMGFGQTAARVPHFQRSAQLFEEKENHRRWESAMEDLNGDGFQDLVITDLGPRTAVYFNGGKGVFVKSNQRFQSDLHGIAIGDIDNDGDNDLVFAALQESGISPIYLNNGKGVFEISDFSGPIEWAERVQLVDIDNDGDLDINLGWGNRLYLNDGTGHFDKSDREIPSGSLFADLNRDGFADIVVAVRNVGFKVYLNDGKGNLNDYGTLEKQDVRFCYTECADIDNDGDLDVIFSNGTEQERYPAGVLLNDGTGRLTDSGQKLSAAAFGFIGAGDLNGDSYVDVIITDRNRPSRIWMNTGKGTFVDSGITLGEGGDWNNCIVKDLDNDGDLDVFITKVYRGNHGLWFNQFVEHKSK